MPIPEKIPVCSNFSVGACNRSDVVVSRDDAECVAFFCRSCQGLQVFTRDNFQRVHQENKRPIIIRPPKPIFDFGRGAGKIR